MPAMPREHALDVAVEDRRRASPNAKAAIAAAVERPMPGSVASVCGVARKRAAVIGDDRARRGVQVCARR